MIPKIIFFNFFKTRKLLYLFYKTIDNINKNLPILTKKVTFTN